MDNEQHGAKASTSSPSAGSSHLSRKRTLSALDDLFVPSDAGSIPPQTSLPAASSSAPEVPQFKTSTMTPTDSPPTANAHAAAYPAPPAGRLPAVSNCPVDGGLGAIIYSYDDGDGNGGSLLLCLNAADRCSGGLSEAAQGIELGYATDRTLISMIDIVCCNDALLYCDCAAAPGSVGGTPLPHTSVHVAVVPSSCGGGEDGAPPPGGVARPGGSHGVGLSPFAPAARYDAGKDELVVYFSAPRPGPGDCYTRVAADPPFWHAPGVMHNEGAFLLCCMHEGVRRVAGLVFEQASRRTTFEPPPVSEASAHPGAGSMPEAPRAEASRRVDFATAPQPSVFLMAIVPPGRLPSVQGGPAEGEGSVTHWYDGMQGLMVFFDPTAEKCTSLSEAAPGVHIGYAADCITFNMIDITHCDEVCLYCDFSAPGRDGLPPPPPEDTATAGQPSSSGGALGGVSSSSSWVAGPPSSSSGASLPQFAPAVRYDAGKDELAVYFSAPCPKPGFNVREPAARSFHDPKMFRNEGAFLLYCMHKGQRRLAGLVFEEASRRTTFEPPPACALHSAPAPALPPTSSYLL